MDLALFDFDGTISTRDSFLLFIKYVAGIKYYPGIFILSPAIALFLCRKYPPQRLKEDFLTTFLKGNEVGRLDAQADHFCQTKIPSIIRPGAAARLRWHRKRQHRIVVVTATPECILAPWCRDNDLELIGTRLGTSNGKLTGKIQGENCRGPAKVKRIREFIRLSDYRRIYAYGDSREDGPMLNLAHQPFYKPFR